MVRRVSKGSLRRSGEPVSRAIPIVRTLCISVASASGVNASSVESGSTSSIARAAGSSPPLHGSFLIGPAVAFAAQGPPTRAAAREAFESHLGATQKRESGLTGIRVVAALDEEMDDDSAK